MSDDELLLEEINKIAKAELPLSMTDEWLQKIWVSGFTNGYLKRTIEVIKQQINE